MNDFIRNFAMRTLPFSNLIWDDEKSIELLNNLDVGKCLPPNLIDNSYMETVRFYGFVDPANSDGKITFETRKKLKSRLVMAFLLVNSARFLYFTQLDSIRDRNLMPYLGDISYYFSAGSVRNILLYGIAFGLLLAVYITYELTHNNSFHRYKCLELIYCLQGELSPIDAQIFNKQVIIKVRSRFNLLYILVKLGVRSFVITNTFLANLMLICMTETIYDFLPWIPWHFINGLVQYICSMISAYGILTFYIVFYYLRIRAALINSQLKSILTRNGFKSKKTLITKFKLRLLLREHTEICGKIIGYNHFMNVPYGIALFISIPTSLLLLQQILFANLNYAALFLYVGIVFACWIMIFIVGHISSAVAREVRRTFKPLTKLQSNMGKHSNLSKWKVTLK